LFDRDLTVINEIDVGIGVKWIQLDDTGGRVLVGRVTGIDVYPLTGSDGGAPRVAIPVGGTSSLGCVFAMNGDLLVVASWDRTPSLSAWDLQSFRLIDEVPLPARGGAGYMLTPHPEGEVMAAVAYSGQSEEWMFWARFAHGRLRVYEQPEVFGVTLPCFHPTGREWVSHHERLGLCRMAFPSAELLGSVRPEEVFPTEDVFSYEMHFFRDDRFMVWQADLALYEFDLATLRPTRTILDGIDGMKFGEGGFFSGMSFRLAGGRLLTTDKLYDKGIRESVRTLRLWDASAFCGEITPTDSSRPYTRKLVDACCL